MSVTTDRKLLIGGEWVDGADGGYDVVNPATEEVVGVAPEALGRPGARRGAGRAGGVPRVVADDAGGARRAAGEGRRTRSRPASTTCCRS